MMRMRCTIASMKRPGAGATRNLKRHRPELRCYLGCDARSLHRPETKFIVASEDLGDGALLVLITPLYERHLHSLEYGRELLLHLSLAVRIGREIEQTEDGAGFSRGA